MKVKLLPHYTLEDWEQWEGKWELIEGIPYAMSPLPTPKHQIISANIYRLLYEELEKCEECVPLISVDWVVSKDTVLEPDNLIVCSDNLEEELFSKKRLEFPPKVVFEILSPSTREKDRINKFYIYEREGVEYYVMVDPDTEEVEVYRLKEGKYSLASKFLREGEFTFELGSCMPKLNFSKLWR
ncbi:Uma2 family endonuclease [Hydrogenivirga sp.]